jgi:hypothetical protein
VLFWALAAAVVAIVRFREKQSLRSLWLQPFRWQSIGWGLVLVAAYYAILLPLGAWVRRAAGLPGLRETLELMCRELAERGVTLLEADTDGVYFPVPEGWPRLTKGA